MLTVAIALLPLLAAGASVPEVIFFPSGYSATSVSDDGSVVTGNWQGGGFRWTEEDGFFLFSQDFVGSVVLSGDSSTIAVDIADDNGKYHAAIWLGGLGGMNWMELPADPPTYASCDAFLLNVQDLNQSGEVAVGLGWVPGCRGHGFRWTAALGTVDLGSSVPGRSSSALAVDATGELIVGYQDNAFGDRLGTKWNWSNETMSAVQSDIPKYVAPGGASYFVGQATAVMGDGSLVAGLRTYGLTGGKAWLWTASTNTTTLLPTLVGSSGSNAIPYAFSADGSTIVGTTGGSPFDRKAIIWIDGVAQNLKTYVTSQGGSVPYTELGNAYDVSADGLTIVGTGGGIGQPWGWVVRLPAASSNGSECPADLDGDKTVGGADLGLLLADWGGTGSSADLNADGVADGADLGLLLAAWGDCS